MKNIYSCANELTEVQQNNLRSVCSDILYELGKHLSEAIRFANHQKISDSDFWVGLFEATDPFGAKSIISEGEGHHFSSQIPSDPYGELDLQACLKYLFYGGSRRKHQDQRNFLNLFVGTANYFYRPPKGKNAPLQLYGDGFCKLLYPGIELRNTMGGHAGSATVSKLTLADLNEYRSIHHILRIVTGLMAPLCTVNWDAAKQQACIDFTKGLWKRVYKSLGEVSYSIPGMMEAMGIPESDRSSVENDFIAAKLRIQRDNVFISGDVSDVAYALYFSWNAVHNKEAEMFQSLYNSVRLTPGTAHDEQEPDWDSLNVEELKVLSDHGNAEAQFRLARCYLTGEGVDADEGEAYSYFHDAANQGHVQAQVQMGKFCELGKGGSDNRFRDPLFPDECLIQLEEAAKWYMKAAEQNDAEGCLNLGRCYEQGIGLPRDMVKARRCYSRAANKGCVEATVAASMLYLRSLGCQNTDKSVAQGMLQTLAETVPAAMTALGICYQHGYGIMPDILEAVKLYQTAAKLGNAQAKYLLAKCYEQGAGVEMDMSTYFTLLHEAAVMGSPEAAIEDGFNPPTWQENDQDSALAQCLLANCLPEEWSGEEILRLYSTAAKKGCQSAVYGMAKCHEFGICAQPDYDRAVYLYKQAANAGEVNAMVRLAGHYHDVACGKAQDDEYLYEGGNGFAMAQAHSWYQFAARCGHPVAQKWMVANSTPKQVEIWSAYAAKCGNHAP